MDVNKFLSHLKNVRVSGDSWKAQCPAHDDPDPSLSISEEDGKILIHCFANCEPASVVGALGLTMSVLFSEPHDKTKNKIVATYDYQDESGNLLYQVVRFEPKDFRPRRKGPDGNWIYDLKGIRRVLYRLPEVLKADRVIIVEGEKDCETLRSLGFVGTTSQGGANGWRPEYQDFLTDKDVLIFPDNDGPGQKYGQAVSRSLRGKAASIKIVKVPSGKDISDFVDLRRREGKKSEDIRAEIQNLLNKEEEIGLVYLSDVRPENIKWLWPGFVPLGKITVFDGDPGLGKSTLSLDISARVTTGKNMPDGSRTEYQGGVVLLTSEDGLADTILPRSKAMGADISKIARLSFVPTDRGEKAPTLQDVDAIRRAIRKVIARLLIIDPLMAHLGGRDSFKDQDVREVLAPIARLAEEENVAVILIRHLNKSGGNQSLYRGGGSIGIVGAARAAFLIAKDPENEGLRVFAPLKNNLAKLPSSLKFQTSEVKLDDVLTSRIDWLGSSPHSSDALLSYAAQIGNLDEKSAFHEAAEFLKETLMSASKPAQELFREAKILGISDVTLKRAKRHLGIKSEKSQFNGGWTWSLPSEGDQKLPRGSLFRDDPLRSEMIPFDKKTGSDSMVPFFSDVEVEYDS